MRVLLIGTDRTVFMEGSAARKRTARLGERAVFDVIIFSTHAHGITTAEEIAPGVRAYPTNSRNRLMYGWDAIRIASQLARPDIISAQDPFEVGLAAWACSRLLRVPFAVEMHTDFLSLSFLRHSLLNRLRVCIARFVIPQARGGYTVSSRLQRDVVRLLRPRGRIGVAPIYVDTSAYAEITKSQHPRFSTTLLWIGRLESEKRPHVALEAFASISKSHPDVGLVMVGAGRLENSLKQRAKELGIEQAVEFIANFQKDVRPYYARADLLLVTSSYEGYGMVIVEALAAGIPVLSTDVGIARDAGAIIADEDYGAALNTWLSGPRTQGTLRLETYKDIDEYLDRLMCCYTMLATKPVEKRLLILTQAVDLDEPLLAFFHNWISALAPHFASIEVVCLKEGRHDLPKNVRVHSLGKETGQSRTEYIRRFYRYIWSLRDEYDSVFVHMNQEYVLLGGPIWRLLQKHVYLWRNYHKGNVGTWIAVHLSNGVFCTSRSSYTARFDKTKLFPIGVDTKSYAEQGVSRVKESILSLGRVTPDKRLDILVEALRELRERGQTFHADIYGNPSEGSDYRETIRQLITDGSLSEVVTMYPGVLNEDTAAIYAAHEIFVNTSPSGMYDKTLIEAAASGCLVLTSIDDFRDAAGPEFWFDGTAKGLADALAVLMSARPEQEEAWRNRLREVVAAHSLDALVERLTTEIQ